MRFSKEILTKYSRFLMRRSGDPCHRNWAISEQILTSVKRKTLLCVIMRLSKNCDNYRHSKRLHNYVVEEKGQCEWFEFNVHVGALTQVVGGGYSGVLSGICKWRQIFIPKNSPTGQIHTPKKAQQPRSWPTNVLSFSILKSFYSRNVAAKFPTQNPTPQKGFAHLHYYYTWVLHPPQE